MAAENWTAQLHISDGLASEDAPEIAYAERPDARGRAAALYILAEPDRPGSEPYIGDLVSRIGEDFLEGEGSLTGVLQRVIRERHEELLDWNRTSLPRDQASYGLSCLVVHEGDVFLMQVGPCLAYYRREGRLLRRRPASEAAAAPLGAAETSTPEFSHLRLGGGDWVLLISSDVARTVGEEAIAALRDRPAEDVLPALYPKLRGLTRVSALVVAPGGVRAAEAPAEAPAIAEEPPARSPAMPPPALDAPPDLDDPYDDEGYDDFPERTPLRDAFGGLFSGLTGLFRRPRPHRPADPWDEDGGEPADESPPRRPAFPIEDAEVAAEEPSDIVEEPDDLAEAEAEVEAEAETEMDAEVDTPDAAPAEVDDEPPADDDDDPPADEASDPPVEEEPPQDTEDAGDAGPPGSARSVEYRLAHEERGPGELQPQAAGWPPNPFNTPAAPVLETGQDADAARFPFPIFTLEGGVPRFRRRREADPARAARSGGMRRGWGALALAVLTVVAVLAVVVGVLLVPDLLQNSEQNRFEDLLEDTRRGLTAASLTSDPAAGRAELTDAHSAIAAALELRPLDESALSLRQEVETALSQINAVVRPPELVEVTNLAGRVPPPLALSLVQVGAGSLYLMDESGARIFALPLAGGDPEVIFAAGEPYPTLFLDEPRAAAAPVGMHWASGAGEPSLTILDAEGQLFRFLPGAGVQALAMPSRELIGSPDAVAVDESGVFVLDVAGGSIWRFPQLPDGALLEPQLAITRTDLSTAGSLAVGDSLFVAGADGRIRRFEDGADQGFPLLDLDRPLLVPDSLAIGALTGLLYTVDRGNNRVAVFSAAGELVVQLRADELSGVRGVVPDESNGRLYFVTADALLTSALPPIIDS
ncbi:MAG: hypothetical protein OXG38_04155 [Chloroflexi bacterium]|nr:hypothetical protein [Chloroflexota bacterium]